jgi:hypothetical protein
MSADKVSQMMAKVSTKAVKPDSQEGKSKGPAAAVDNVNLGSQDELQKEPAAAVKKMDPDSQDGQVELPKEPMAAVNDLNPGSQEGPVELSKGLIRVLHQIKSGSQDGKLKFSKLFDSAVSSFLNQHGCLHLTDTQQIELAANPQQLSDSQLASRIATWVPSQVSKKGHVQQYTGQCCGCKRTKLRVSSFKPSMERLYFCPACLQHHGRIQVSDTTTLIRGRHPDILFLQPVSINGTLVRWIECKAYYGSAVLTYEKKYERLPVNRIQAQLNRYKKHYGPGAILFLKGFHANVNLTGALLLDATPLDLSAVNAFKSP